MSIPAADLRKLVKIVRQYEVIYGGGISSGDAAVREECEDLVAALEAELGEKRRGGRDEAASLPSLVEAKKSPRADASGKPRSARTAAMAELGNRAQLDGSVERRAAAARPQAAAAKDKAVVPAKAGAGAAPTRPSAGAASRKAGPGAKPSGRAASPAPAKGAAATAKGAATPAKGAAATAKGAASSGAPKAAEPKRLFAALHLFDAFAQNRLPKYGGYIVCIRFSAESGYTIVEIIGYENLQDIYPEGDTLVFKSVGCKLFAIVEPSTYLLKSVEPVNRPSDQMVPYRFAELVRITTKQFQSILIGRKPVFMPSSFSVFKPAGEDLAVLFYDMAEVYANIQDFLIMMFRDRLGVPASDSRKAAEAIARGTREFRLWLDEA
jgi:hypothetical protein